MISVIIPVYNAEKYLPKCIESVLSQTYTDIELILVDDGSPDNSGKICDEYALKDSRIRVIHQKNGGQSSARNAGLDIATGEFISFVDSDDYIDSNMLQVLYESLVQNNADISGCCLKCVDENGNRTTDSFLKAFDETKIFDKNQLIYNITHYGDYYTNFVVVCSKLYKREVFSKLRFIEGRIHEDEMIVHHIYLSISKAVIIPNEYYYYLRHSGTTTSAPFSIKRLDAAYAFYDRYITLNSNGFGEYAISSLRASYGKVICGLKQLSYKKYEKELKPIVKKLMKTRQLGLRRAKLICAILFNRCRFKNKK